MLPMLEVMMGLTTNSTQCISSNYRKRVLSKVYEFILSLPDPQEKKTEPAEGSGGDAAGSTGDDKPETASSNINFTTVKTVIDVEPGNNNDFMGGKHARP